jgi:hypothetical protein
VRNRSQSHYGGGVKLHPGDTQMVVSIEIYLNN